MVVIAQYHAVSHSNTRASHPPGPRAALALSGTKASPEYRELNPSGVEASVLTINASSTWRQLGSSEGL